MLEPVIVSFCVNIAYLLVGIVLLRLLLAYLNRSSISGDKFTLHDAMDKINENPIALSIVVAGFVVGFGILCSAFIRG